MKWTLYIYGRGVADNIEFNLQVSNNKSFTDLVFDTIHNNTTFDYFGRENLGTSNTYPYQQLYSYENALLFSQKYYWRVKAIDRNSNGDIINETDWSEVTEFTLVSNYNVCTKIDIQNCSSSCFFKDIEFFSEGNSISCIANKSSTDYYRFKFESDSVYYVNSFSERIGGYSIESDYMSLLEDNNQYYLFRTARYSNYFFDRIDFLADPYSTPINTNLPDLSYQAKDFEIKKVDNNYIGFSTSYDKELKLIQLGNDIENSTYTITNFGNSNAEKVNYIFSNNQHYVVILTDEQNIELWNFGANFNVSTYSKTNIILPIENVTDFSIETDGNNWYILTSKVLIKYSGIPSDNNYEIYSFYNLDSVDRFKLKYIKGKLLTVFTTTTGKILYSDISKAL